MAKFVPKVYEDILQRMVNHVVSRTALTDLTESSVGKTLLASVAREIDDVYYAVVNLLKSFSIDTAQGTDLDERAADYNLTRAPAEVAVGALVFSRAGTSGLVTIPAGVRVKVPGANPEIVAVTTAAGSIPDLASSSAPVAAVMEKPGARGNVALNTLSAFKSAKPTGVDSVANPNPFGAGQDLETDDAFRTRIRAYLGTLARCTIAALEYIASTVAIPSGKRVIFAKAVKDPIQLGRVYLYVDDGAGSAEATDDTNGTPELLITGVEFPGGVAQGGEQYLYTANFPIKETTSIIVVRTPGGTLTRDVDFTLDPASGQIYLVDPLDAGDTVTIEYTWYIDLIAEVQKVVDGDPTDRANYHGWRAAGDLVVVRVPTIVNVVLEAGIVVLDGYDRALVADAVASALASYVNGLGIGGNIVLSELIERAMEVEGMYDIQFFQPTTNLPMLDNQLPRVDALTGISLT